MLWFLFFLFFSLSFFPVGREKKKCVYIYEINHSIRIFLKDDSILFPRIYLFCDLRLLFLSLVFFW